MGENPKYQGLPSFLFGQSLGGEVALKVHFKQPNAWNGAVLVAPMCNIAEDVVPPWPLQQILICMAELLPRGKLVAQNDLAEMAFKEPKKGEQVSLPLLILHGKADTVTEHSVSKALYEKASSPDKKLRLYSDACHSLLEGEIFQVVGDIISWLDEHCAKEASS